MKACKWVKNFPIFLLMKKFVVLVWWESDSCFVVTLIFSLGVGDPTASAKVKMWTLDQELSALNKAGPCAVCNKTTEVSSAELTSHLTISCDPWSHKSLTTGNAAIPIDENRMNIDMVQFPSISSPAEAGDGFFIDKEFADLIDGIFWPASVACC